MRCTDRRIIGLFVSLGSGVRASGGPVSPLAPSAVQQLVPQHGGHGPAVAEPLVDDRFEQVVVRDRLDRDRLVVVEVALGRGRTAATRR